LDRSPAEWSGKLGGNHKNKNFIFFFARKVDTFFVFFLRCSRQNLENGGLHKILSLSRIIENEDDFESLHIGLLIRTFGF